MTELEIRWGFILHPDIMCKLAITKQEREVLFYFMKIPGSADELEVSKSFSISVNHALSVMRRLYSKGYLVRERSGIPNKRDGRDKFVYRFEGQ